jgi:hypothetical protein
MIMTDRTCRTLLALALLFGSCPFYAACDDSSALKETSADAGGRPGPAPGPNGSDAGDLDGGSKDCFDSPKTHFEIINACTNATKIAKTPTLTKLLPDGGLPPLN